MIHAVLVAYKNHGHTRTRWVRDVRPGLTLAGGHFGLPTCVTCIDNSPDPSDDLRELFGDGYVWNHGHNFQYGPAINQAVRRVPSAFTLYNCTVHGRAIDHGWATDLIAPLVADPVVGMTGYLVGSNSPEGVAHATGQEWVKEKYRFVDDAGNGYVPQHVQGGVFAARTELLLRYPYYDTVAHLYSDHTITWDALKAGYRVVDVPSVRSVWRDVWPRHKMDGVRYLHDSSDLCTT